jgi:RNA polymerase sigma factor (sigma-70 family)
MRRKVREKCSETFRQEIADVFEQYSSLMYEAARSIIGDRALAQDAVQNVFMTLIDAKPSADFMKNPRGYLYRAAINAARDLVKSRSRQRLIDNDVGSLEIPVPSPDAKLDPQIERLRAAMAVMDPDDAETLKLHYVEGYTCEEIAKVRGKFVAAVWMELSRARNELEKLMKENDSETQKGKDQGFDKPGLAEGSEA